MNTNADLKDLLPGIVADKATHARWLNTFSYMEYVGFRKILKSQPSSRMTIDLLSHAVEEGRHALRLKKLAIATGGKAFEHYSEETMISGTQAGRYFHDLDKACSGLLSATESPFLTYLYVTWLVELRAIEIYRSYAAVAKVDSLKALIGEEDHHLQSVSEQIKLLDSNFERHSQKLIAKEKELYEQFLLSLRKDLVGV